MSLLKLNAKDYSNKLTDVELAQRIRQSMYRDLGSLGNVDGRIPALSDNNNHWTYNSQETFKSAVESVIQAANQSSNDLFEQLDFARIARLCTELYVLDTFQYVASISVTYNYVLLCQLTNTGLVGKQRRAMRVELDVDKMWSNARAYVNSKSAVDWFAVAKYAGITWSVLFAAGLSLCALAHVTKPK
jgi:hypothetical protein